MTVFFGGHEMAQYHLPQNYHLGDAEVWSKVCGEVGLQPVEGRDRTYKRVS